MVDALSFSQRYIDLFVNVAVYITEHNKVTICECFRHSHEFPTTSPHDHDRILTNMTSTVRTPARNHTVHNVPTLLTQASTSFIGTPLEVDRGSYFHASLTGNPSSRPSSLDDVGDYKPGVFHPIAIGDLFSQGRYGIIHKLAFGRSSTIWLARSNL